MKYPIGIQSFEDIRTNGYVYVDKTDLVYKLADEGKVYFLSRPRRFGKSLLVDTLACYFEGRKELFVGLAIDKLEQKWHKYPVFRVDFNGGEYTKSGELERKIESYVATWERQYGKDELETTVGTRFIGVLRRAYEKTGYKAVVLIDEYDKPLLDVIDSGIKNSDTQRLLEDSHREILKAFYSTFKAADNYLKFVLLTGVTKFSQVSVFSGFNQPVDISMNRFYESLCGITKAELTQYFAGPMERLAEMEGMSYDALKNKLKCQYDGYHFGRNMVDIFNPFSILNAFNEMAVRDYWFATGSPTYLIRLMNHFNEGLDNLLGKEYPESAFMDYKADVERPLPMLFQSGYLTIKSYNMRKGTYRLDFPNNEVSSGFLSLLASNYFQSKQLMPGSLANDMAEMLELGEPDKFIASMTIFLAGIPYDSHDSTKTEKLSEKHFQYTFYLMLRLIGSYRITTLVEQRQSEGRVDCIALTNDYIYVFEFKKDGSAADALQQIEDKGYATSYLADSRKLFKVGVNFSTAKRTISEYLVAE